MSYLNLVAQPIKRRSSWWGRVIFYVADVDALYQRALAAGCQPLMELDDLGAHDSVTITASRLPGDKFKVQSGNSSIDTVILADQVLELRMRGGQIHVLPSRRSRPLSGRCPR
jgi:hypothetical protein